MIQLISKQKYKLSKLIMEKSISIQFWGVIFLKMALYIFLRAMTHLNKMVWPRERIEIF